MDKMRKRGFTGSLTDEISALEAENRSISRRAAAEGITLLKNADHILPLKKGSKVAVYGAGASFTVKGGTGSGDVNERYSVSITEGLRNAGFQISNETWLKDYEEEYHNARLAWREKILSFSNDAGGLGFMEHYFSIPFLAPAGKLKDKSAARNDGADTALFVLRRIAGEGKDRLNGKGDFELTDEELTLLKDVCECYKSVVFIINSGGIIDLRFTDALSNLDAIVYLVQGGEEGGNALADILCGDSVPSGKLTDTWANKYSDYPCHDTFSYLSGNVFRENYNEGIYVGYRYFDTFEVPVRYSFGYGLSYTGFRIETLGIKADSKEVTVTVNVKNIGNIYTGKEVIQIYVSCPQNDLPKELRRLCGYGKTKALAPNEEQTMEISFAIRNMASYCEQCHSWILEGGKYGIWVGNSLNSAELVGSVSLSGQIFLEKCDSICPCQEALSPIEPDTSRIRTITDKWQKMLEDLPCAALPSEEIETNDIVYSALPETFEGEAGKLINSLSVDELILLATGDPSSSQNSVLGSAGQTVPGAAAETPHRLEDKNIASIVLTDGPAGLRLKRTYYIHNGVCDAGDMIENFERGFLAPHKEHKGTPMYQNCTAFPVGTLLAQTWNPELVSQIGEAVGKEMLVFETTLWLAPGMNIHRNPLCGRNFEYYSEDPLIAGTMAAAMTNGVQRIPGCGTTIKHFACNSQEDNRMGSDSVLSERALREIYLRGFEIAIKSSQPMSIMTSYNLINGVHAANCYDICTKAARDEWGFAGAIMTDWLTTSPGRQLNGTCTAAGCMKAGNDMVMPGENSDHENIRAALDSGELTLNELKRCIYRTVNIILASNQYENAESYHDRFSELPTFVSVK